MLRWRGDESLEIYAHISDYQWRARVIDSYSAVVDAAVVARLPSAVGRIDIADIALAHSGADVATAPDAASAAQLAEALGSIGATTTDSSAGPSQ